MRIPLFIFTLIPLILCAHISPAQNTVSYYYRGGLVNLSVDTTTLLIKFNNLAAGAGYELIRDSIPAITYDPTLSNILDGFGIFRLAQGADSRAIREQLNSFAAVKFINPFTLIYDSIPIYMTDKFVVQFYSYYSKAIIDSLIRCYSLEVVKSDAFAKGRYIFRITRETNHSIIDISNLFYELECTAYSHPAFFCRAVADSYSILDAYYPQQINIKKTIDYPNHANGCWEISTGNADVIISVIDDGFEWHEDLDTNHLLAGFDFQDADTVPAYSDTSKYAYHGMACAGLIFGMHNNIVDENESPKTDPKGSFNSIVGIAPGCSFLPIRHVMFSNWPNPPILLDIDAADAISYAFRNGAAVINYNYTISITCDDVEAAIDSAYYYGRGGLGTIIVFSAGNRILSFPCHLSPPKDMATVLCVAALDTTDLIDDISCHGDSLDLVATTVRSATWSWDRMDSLGRNPHYPSNCLPANDIDYSCDLRGTSFAAPQVAATAALLLSRNPYLFASQVFEILRKSADTLLATVIHPQDPYYGYGRVNAFKALLSIVRGDANNDVTINILDISFVTDWLYNGGPAPQPDPLMADANCDGNANILDVAYLVNYLYHSGPLPQICFKY